MSPKVLELVGGNMNSRVAESDWKRFRRLREGALDRFCSRILDEVAEVLSDSARTHHERYLEVHRILTVRNGEMAKAFDAPARLRMVLQLALIYDLGLLDPNDLTEMTSKAQDQVQALGEVWNWS